jgi:hypothetical protein
MIYNNKELISIIDDVTSIISKKIYNSNAQGVLEDYLESIDLKHVIEKTEHYNYVIPNRSKIMILAYQLNKDILTLEAKKQGFDPKRFDFVEFHTGFDIRNLEYSQIYTDILIGPIPHKMINLGSETSLIAAIENHPEKYPKLHKLSNSSGELKVTKNAFVETLYKTVFFRKCM